MSAEAVAPHLRRARFSVVVAFSVHAAVAGSLGPRIPALKEQAGLSAGGLGVSLTGYALGLFAHRQRLQYSAGSYFQHAG